MLETYLYDGDGRRVKKVGPSTTLAYVYDALGQLAAEYSTATNTPVCTTCYLVWDHLGSTRLVTDQKAAIISRHDFLPSGEEIAGGTAARSNQWGSTADVTQKFTGQERDYENTPSLDYFGARYYGSALGRFSSVDPENAGSDPSDPQSWNGYSYALNNPLVYTDPDGMDPQNDDPCKGNPNCVTVTAKPDPIQTVAIDLLGSYLNIVNQTNQITTHVWNWLTQPRNGPCVAAMTTGGASVGAGVGMLGLVGGPAVGATEPTGMAVGGGIGWLGGMVSCMSSSGGTGSSGQATGNDKPPKEWQITNPADKKVVGGRTYLKDAKTGTWWSKDTAGHGGSVWKVYKETSPGKLDWIADADAQGNFISGKWKSPAGTSISF